MNKSVSTIIVIIIGVLLVALFVLPKYREAGDLGVLFSQKQAEYNGKAQYYTRVSQLLAQVRNRQEALEKVDSSLPLESSLADLTYFFQKNAADNGLAVTSLEFSQASPVAYRKASVNGATKELENIVFTMSFLGSYQGFKNFLVALDTSSRMFETNTISFAQVQAPQARGQARASLPVYDFKLEIITHAY